MDKIPESVIVGPLRIRIITSQSAIEQARLKAGDKRVGQYEWATQSITIDPGQGEDEQADTLLHELLHAILRVVGAPAEGLTDEQVIGHLSLMLLDTLRRNPALVAYLCERGRAAPGVSFGGSMLGVNGVHS